jgi:threonine dehydratase
VAQLHEVAVPGRPAIGLPEIEAAARRVYAVMPPAPQYAWPLLARRAGCEVWVKHENHTPTGAFKVRGGLNLLGTLAEAGDLPKGVISATRGNHGQSLAFAARQLAGEEPRDARVGRRVGRARPRLRRSA